MKFLNSCRKKITIITFVFLIFFSIYWLRGMLFLDPDFGWHLRLGQIILEKGILNKDPFSYTMPSFPLIDHEWLINVLIAKLYTMIGFVGLAGIFAFVTVAALFTQIPFYIKKWLSMPFFMLSAASLLTFTGVRTQVITWLFFSILLKVILDEKLWEKWRFLVPLLILVWANMHAGFAIGIFTVCVAVLTRLWESKKIDIEDFTVLLLGLLATWINPYGTRIWGEIWMQMSDSSLRWSIGEWMPAIFMFNVAWFFLPFSLVVFLRYRKKLNKGEIILYFGLLLAGLSSTRHMPFWIIFCLPLTSRGFYWFFLEVCQKKNALRRFHKAYKFFVIIVLGIILFQVFNDFRIAYSMREVSFYPQKAVEFLRKNSTDGQIFSQYNWGGYLIWKLPEKKVFIDGRMPGWKRNSSAKESNDAFRDYKDLLSGKMKFQSAVNKYNIDTILLPVGLRQKKGIVDKFSDWLFSILAHFGKKEEKYSSIIVYLTTNNYWREIYRDSVAVIYRK